MAWRRNSGTRRESHWWGTDPLSWREFLDHKTSMITDEDPLRDLLFYSDLGFSQTEPFLHVLTEPLDPDSLRFDHDDTTTGQIGLFGPINLH